MSTNDVPGFNPANRDQLAMGCWAEHEDGSLIFVENVEAGRVIYSMFDCAMTPPVEYRDAQPEDQFKRTFSWPHSTDKWTWHDKTPFPWDRVIQQGARDGLRYADVADQLSAAQRVAQSLHLRGSQVSRDLQNPSPAPQSDTTIERVKNIMNQLQDAISRLQGR